MERQKKLLKQLMVNETLHTSPSIHNCFDKRMVKINKHMDKGFQIGNPQVF